MKVKVAHGRKPKEFQPEQARYKGEDVIIKGRNGKSVRIQTSKGDIIVLEEVLDVLQAESMGEHAEGNPSQG